MHGLGRNYQLFSAKNLRYNSLRDNCIRPRIKSGALWSAEMKSNGLRGRLMGIETVLIIRKSGVLYDPDTYNQSRWPAARPVWILPAITSDQTLLLVRLAL